MARWKLLGDLERLVMEVLWDTVTPQTVRDVHARVTARHELAYTTVMTVLRRLAEKGLVIQDRGERAHRYCAAHTRDELVAGVMMDALDQVLGSGDKRSALVHFAERVDSEDLHVLQQALAEVDNRQASA